MTDALDAVDRPVPEEKPAPPDDLAQYVREAVERQDPETLRALGRWAFDLAAWREREIELEDEIDESEELVDVEESDGGTIVTKKVPCGKENCSTCPHGPYQYRVQREGDSVTWEYLGKA